MVLSEREKYIAIGLGAVVVLVLLWEFVYGPLIDWQKSIDDQQDALQAKLTKDTQLNDKKRRLARIWKDMIDNGLKSDPADAEAQLEIAMSNWARDSGLTLTSQRHEQSLTADKTGFIPISYAAGGSGTTSETSKLLWQIETAKIPVRINSLTINSKTEGADDLLLQLNLSTLCSSDVQGKGTAAAPPPTTPRGNSAEDQP